MFTALLVFAVALSSASCNKFVIGVRLLLPERPVPPTPACDLLRSRSLARWREGTFSHCIFKHAEETTGRNFSISYSITVDPTKNAEFPVGQTYAGKVAFVNEQLNLDTTNCLTVAGSHWGKPIQDSGMNLEIELYLRTTANDLTPVTCNTINERLGVINRLIGSPNCFHEELPYTFQTFHQHRFVLHPQVTTGYDRNPPARRVLSVLSFALSVTKSAQLNCIRVTNARYNSTGRIWRLELYVPSQNTTVSACSFLNSFIGHLPIICHPLINLKQQHNDSEQRIRLDIPVNVLDQSATNIDSFEAVLRTHSLVNNETAGCLIAKVDQLKEAFKPVPYKGYYSAVMSGPVGATFCRKEKARSPITAHSCVVVRRPLEEGDDGVYRLRPKEPFYSIDLPWFMNKHHELVNQLNSRNSRCDFNGFIQLNTDDPIHEPNHEISEVYTSQHYG